MPTQLTVRDILSMNTESRLAVIMNKPPQDRVYLESERLVPVPLQNLRKEIDTPSMFKKAKGHVVIVKHPQELHRYPVLWIEVFS